MREIRFNPSLGLILIDGRVWGPLGDRPLVLALDTGSSETLLAPEILDRLGYSPKDAEVVTTVTSVVGIEKGYRRRVTRFAALEFEHADFVVHAHDLPEDCGLDGLLGLNFLRHMNYEVRSREGVIRVERA